LKSLESVRLYLQAEFVQYGSLSDVKRLFSIFLCTALMAVLAWIVWLAGMVFELEYPYTFKLLAVGKAISYEGVPVAKIITSDGGDWSGRLNWYMCSYCADRCGNYDNLVSVRLDTPDRKVSYYFAYCIETRTLVPMTEHTAAHFPSLMPKGDRLETVTVLTRGGSGGSIGAGELMLPANWFRTVTR
jgi:hypothetical protein